MKFFATLDVNSIDHMNFTNDIYKTNSNLAHLQRFLVIELALDTLHLQGYAFDQDVNEDLRKRETKKVDYEDEDETSNRKCLNYFEQLLKLVKLNAGKDLRKTSWKRSLLKCIPCWMENSKARTPSFRYRLKLMSIGEPYLRGTRKES
jgi:hypothetical protein